MNEKQEIRAKALELMIAAFALLPGESRRNQFVKAQEKGIDLPHAIVNGSKIFEDFIADTK
jgi:hypothetical protein